MACVNPDPEFIPGTLVTLQYASRARGIRNNPVVNVLDERSHNVMQANSPPQKPLPSAFSAESTHHMYQQNGSPPSAAVTSPLTLHSVTTTASSFGSPHVFRSPMSTTPASPPPPAIPLLPLAPSQQHSGSPGDTLDVPHTGSSPDRFYSPGTPRTVHAEQIVRTLTVEMTHARARIADLEAEKALLMEAVQSLDTLYTAVRVYSDELTEKLQATSQQLTETSTEEHRLEEALRAEVQRSTELHGLVTKLQHDLEVAHSVTESQGVELRRLRSKAESLKENVAEVSGFCFLCSVFEKETLNKLSQHSVQLNEVSDARAEAETHLTACLDELARLKNLHDNDVVRLGELTAKDEARDAEMATFSSKLRQAMQDLEHARQVREQLATTSEQLASTQRHSEEVERELTQVKESLQEETLQVLMSACSEFSTVSSHSRQKRTSAERELHVTQQTLEHLKDELVRARQTLAQRDGALAQLQAEVESLRTGADHPVAQQRGRRIVELEDLLRGSVFVASPRLITTNSPARPSGRTPRGLIGTGAVAADAHCRGRTRALLVTGDPVGGRASQAGGD